MKISLRIRLCCMLWLSILFTYPDNNIYGISSIHEVQDYEVNVLENSVKTESILRVDFRFPETVKAGQSFTFQFVIAKESEHSIGGKFLFKWPGGFTPMVSDNPKVKCTIDDSKIYVEWDAQLFPQDVKISYPVQVSNVSSGVYPVLSTLTFLGGLQVEKNTKIRVEAAETTIRAENTAIKPAENFSIRMDFPIEVEFGGGFGLNILLYKGSSSEPAMIKVSLPPSSDVSVLNHDDFEYNKYSGELIIKWKNLPVNPNISIDCEVITNSSIKAAYPITAEFFIDKKLRATYLNSIYLTDKIQQVKSMTAEKVKNEPDREKTDSIKLYAEMDELLNKWKDATNNITIETGQANSIYRSEKPVVVQSIDPVNDRKTDSGTTTKNYIENLQKQQVQPDTSSEGAKVYRVQIAASKTILSGTKQFVQSLGFFETILEDYDGTWYRCFIGEFSQISEARDFNQKLKDKGIVDSFVVTFIDGKKVPNN